MGFGGLAEICHALETALLKINRGELPVSARLVGDMLGSVDAVRDRVEGARGSETPQVACDDWVSKLKEAVSAPVQAAAPVPAAPVVPVASTVESVAPVPGPVQAANVVEDILSPRPGAPAHHAPPPTGGGSAAEGSIRVGLKRIEHLTNNVGELVILKGVLTQHMHVFETDLLRKTLIQLSKVTNEIQELSMGLRMVPLKATFQMLHRVVRDTREAVSKDVRLETVGEDTEVDKTVAERLSDPLVHIIRNAIDHGIESAEARAQAGKNPQGTIRVSAYRRSGRLVIDIQDDGGGVNSDKVRARAVERGLIGAGTKVGDREAIELLFLPGFSTKDQVTEISGRGVGLDVVRSNIESLQGEVEVESRPGQGSLFRVSVPLTLSIIDVMVVRAGAERYLVPVTQVHEAVQLDGSHVNVIAGSGEVFALRGETIPLYRMQALLGRMGTISDDSTILVVRGAGRVFGVAVDEVLRQQQVVTRQVGREIRDQRGFAGSAILGDGKPGLILELHELVQRFKSRAIRAPEARTPQREAA
jgi:two-component system chemotaxis sensor kinase CheA